MKQRGALQSQSFEDWLMEEQDRKVIDGLLDDIKKSSSSASSRASNAKLQTSYLEGLYLRVDDGPYLKHRAKLVRSDFIQHIDKGTHWIRQIRKQNRVNYDGSTYDPNANAVEQHSLAATAD